MGQDLAEVIVKFFRIAFSEPLFEHLCPRDCPSHVISFELIEKYRMAHFFPAPGRPREAYDIDGKAALDSISRLDIALGETVPIGLFGGRQLTLKTIPRMIVKEPIRREGAPGGNEVLFLEGGSVGQTVLETLLGSSRSVTLQIKVYPIARIVASGSRQAGPQNFEQAGVEFARGFVDGLAQKLDGQLGAEILTKIQGDLVGFQRGFGLGVLHGLWDGLKSLVDMLELVGKVATVATPWGLAAEAVLSATFESHRKKRLKELDEVLAAIANAREMALVAAKVVAEISARPSLYLPQSRMAGLVIGAELADMVAKEARGMSAEATGRLVGRIVGLVLFEIIVQILVAVFTGGLGNAAKGGLSAAEGGGVVARLAARLERVFEGLPALRRLILSFRGEQAIAEGAAIALDAEIELAFGEGAVLQRGARGGFPILERLPALSEEARVAAGKLLGQQLQPELVSAWNACSNSQAVSEIADVQRLLKTGSAVDRETAYQLSERTYGNWRNRFWTRVRGDAKLQKIFTDAGASFEGKSGAPFFKMDGARTKNLTVTLDHFVERRVDNPGRAVDALNVRPSISFENSATLEAIRKDNFLKGWSSP